MFFTTKSQLLECLLPKNDSEEPPSVYDCKIIDGAVMIHSLPRKSASTFQDYAQYIFNPYLCQQLRTSNRLDVVWDRFLQDSLKEATHEKRGTGSRLKVGNQTKIPAKWVEFLKVSENKEELFAYLTAEATKMALPPGKRLVMTGQDAESDLARCDHEEADTHIVVHILDALQSGHSLIQVRSVDMDVVVILLGVYSKLRSQHDDLQLWAAFGMGAHYTCVDIGSLSATLGDRAKALTAFHAFTGCDTTSGFHWSSKKKAWRVWDMLPELTDAFLAIAREPFLNVTTESPVFAVLERFVVLLYDSKLSTTSINEARMMMFKTKPRPLNKLPPTQNVLLHHTRRAVYQTGIWTMSTTPTRPTTCPLEFGWVRCDGGWQPLWMTQPEVSLACREFIKCACAMPCKVCRCFRANLKCTSLCKCACQK
uniref:uncharacterized protein n=1 Tax=Myxine glutinosa TaxID=7769 RepID=UPI00358F36DD